VTNTTYDDATRLDYEFLTEPIKDTDTIENIQEPTYTQDANIQEPELINLIRAPFASGVSAGNFNTIDNEYKPITFPYTTGTSQTEYDITFYEDTECDILIVGGGGGGGRRGGGGGGAGSCIYHKNQVLNGNYDITVGKGGNVAQSPDVSGDSSGSNGINSEFIKPDGTKKYLAIGGAGGHGSRFPVNNSGGSAAGLNYG